MRNKKLVKKPQILNGITLKTKPINVYKLHSCLDCQRIINDPRVQRIYDDWIDGYYVRPLVNYVNGEYRLIGGQHTVAAFIKRIENGLEETTTIDCRVSENLSEAQVEILKLMIVNYLPIGIIQASIYQMKKAENYMMLMKF